jgi:hypothetical protein
MRARRITARYEVDRLEQVRLSGPVRSDEGHGATRERYLDLRVAAKVLQRELGDAHV